MKCNRLYIHAVNIHCGGGKTLLLAFLKSVGLIPSIISVDERMQPALESMALNAIEIDLVKPTLLHRLLAELRLLRRIVKSDYLFCFGSLPPLFRSQAYTAVFIQNRYLIEVLDLKGFHPSVRLRILFERLWLKLTFKNADEFIVQSMSMYRLLHLIIGDSAKIRVLPFQGELNSDDYDPLTLSFKDIQRFDFTYIASGEPHKNHNNLIKAWCILADEGIYPSLCLTINSLYFPEICHSIDQLIRSRNLMIFNLGTLTYSEIHSLYKRSNATIYPSKLESLGLPLIEARDAGLPIIASELDYVRDILNPEQSFDPESPISIARAVKRQLGLIETPQTIMNADEFLRAIWN